MTRVSRQLLLLSLVALIVAACGGNGDDAEPTATAVPTRTEESAAPTQTAAFTGSTATDGVCQVTIPDDWVDVGTGRGTTGRGDRWSLFGGSIASDAAWINAKELLRAQMNSAPDAEITDEGDRITVTTPDGRRYIVRQRFADRYCELSVTGTQEAAEDEQAVRRSVADTLAPVSND